MGEGQTQTPGIDLDPLNRMYHGQKKKWGYFSLDLTR